MINHFFVKFERHEKGTKEIQKQRENGESKVCETDEIMDWYLFMQQLYWQLGLSNVPADPVEQIAVV